MGVISGKHAKTHACRQSLDRMNKAKLLSYSMHDETVTVNSNINTCFAHVCMCVLKSFLGCQQFF